MIRPLKAAAAAALMLCLMAGAAYAATRTVPENKPQAPLMNTTPNDLPGDAQALNLALKAADPVKYKVLVVDSTDGEDKTDYLDRVAAQWGEPAADTLLLIVFTQDNYDIRFYMGANFRAHDVTVAEMLKYIRTLYLPKARVGDAAGGLADLAKTVNERMSKVAITYPDPFGDGPRRTAVAELELGKGLLVGFLDQWKGAATPEAQRVNEYRFDTNKINPVSATADTIVYMVTFDVQPLHPDTYVNAGNGVQGDGGWITGKTLFLKAVKEGSVWRLESTATSP